MITSSPFNEESADWSVGGEEIHETTKIMFGEGEKCKTLESISITEGNSNYYKDRLSLKEISTHIDTQEEFDMVSFFPPKPSPISCSGKDILKTIPDVPKFKSEPKTGLFPRHVDVDKYEETRKNPSKTPYKDFIPSKYKPELPVLKKFEEFTEEETISKPEEINSKPSNDIYRIILQDFRLISNNFFTKLSRFKTCTVLVLRQLGLESLLGLKLPNLRVLDIRGNLVATTEHITPTLVESQYIEHLDVSENPVERMPNCRSLLISSCPRIISLNGQSITFAEKELIFENFGTPLSKQRFSYLKWDNRMNILCEMINLDTWKPEKITTLSLASAKLSEVHVGNFVNLQTLDLSNNYLKSLFGFGLEKLDKLRELDISNNMIQDEKCFSVISMIPELRHLQIKSHSFSDYERVRNYAIYMTLNLKGDNRTVGLLSLDGKEITVDHRIAAIKLFGDLSDDELRRLRWNYCLIKYYGHNQIRKLCNSQYLSVVTKLIVPECRLTVSDLSFMISLEYVDLRSNNLLQVIGIEKLKHLKYFDVSNNPLLEIYEVVLELSKLTTLQNVTLYPTSVAQVYDYNQRATNLTYLLERNDKLFILDNIKIDIKERSKAIKDIHNLSEIEELKYRFGLAVTLQVLADNYKFGIKDVIPGRRFDPSTVLRLYLRECFLKDAGINLTLFVNLQYLDLSNNYINNIILIGLRNCKDLRFLDLSNNNISNDIQDVIDILNCMRDLEMISMKGNENLEKTKNYRSRILLGLNTMQSICSKLVMFNTKITANDRQTVWTKLNINHDEHMDVRFTKAMEERGYSKKNPLLIREINLNELALSRVEVQSFINTELLLLRNNQLSSLKDTGILNFKLLRCVDLKNNRLNNLAEIILLVNENPFLETLGIYGQDEEKNFLGLNEVQVRTTIIQNVPKLANIFCPFWEIDDREITDDEIIENWPLRSNETKRLYFRFERTLFKRYVQTLKSVNLISVTVKREEIVSLDLSNSQLQYLNFEGFVNLSKLSLANNMINDESMLNSRLTITPLQQLDIQSNHIENLSTVVNLVDSCETLQKLFLSDNPCYMPFNQKNAVNRDYRKTFLRLLKSTRDPLWNFELDGICVSVEERCEAIKNDVPYHELGLIRLELYLAEQKYTDNDTTVILQRKEISLLRKLQDFKNLVYLDLRSNRITDVDRVVFKSLPSLTHLDLRDNEITSKTVLDDIGVACSLKILFLHRAGPSFNDPYLYVVDVFSTMRALNSLDGIPNPFPLTEFQQLAVNYLFTYYEISPNSLSNLQFEKQISSNQFYSILLALTALVTFYTNTLIGPKSVAFNLTKSISDYNFLLLSHIKSLEMIDNHKIHPDERIATVIHIKSLQKLIAKSEADSVISDLRPILSFSTVKKSLEDQKNEQIAQDIENEIISNVNVSTPTIDFKFIEDNYNNIPIIQIYKHLLNSRNELLGTFNGFVDKIGVLLYFLQLFAVVYSYNIPWPEYYSIVAKWSLLSLLGIDLIWDDIKTNNYYLRYSLQMIAPVFFLTLCLIKINRNRCQTLATKCLPVTIVATFIIFILLSFIATLLSFATYPKTYQEIFYGIAPSEKDVWGAFGFLLGIVLTIFIFALILIIIASVTIKNPSFWYKFFVKLRQRICFLLFNLSYFAAVRVIFASFECDRNQKYLRFYPPALCPSINKPEDFPAIYWVSIGFAGFYCVILPIILVFLINKDYSKFIKKFGIEDDICTIKEKEKQLKKDKKNKEMKKDLNNSRRLLSLKYINCVSNLKSGASVMYAPYRSFFRFEGVVRLIQATIICCLASTLRYFTLVQTPIVSGLFLAFCLYVIITRPYSDITTSLSSLIVQFICGFNLLFGYLLVRKDEIPQSVEWLKPSDTASTAVLYTINGVTVVLILSLFCITPIRNYLRSYMSDSNKKNIKERLAKISEVATEQYKYGIENLYVTIIPPSSYGVSGENVCYVDEECVEDSNIEPAEGLSTPEIVIDIEEGSNSPNLGSEENQ
ncbi:hypothetical protein ABK040_010277 [Willaertia magna]